MPEVLFVGREREIDVYKKFLARETPWVLIITGLGGIGKTTLLHRLAEYTSSEATLLKTGVVTLDFANEELRNDPLKLLDKLTTDTAPYCDLQQIDSEFKNELLESLDQLAQLSKERAQTGTSDPEDLALREIRHQMRELATEAFYLQIKTFTLERLVVMLDTCEWLSEPEGIEVGQWVLNELIPEIHTRIRQKGRQCPVVMFSRLQPRLDVIKGQDQRRLTLPMLGKAEVDHYLEHMGMRDAELRQRVYEVTHGHALCVSIIGDFWQQREAQEQPLTLADLPELQVQEFSEIALMRFTNERVLRQLKPPFKELTQYGVLLRSFDLPLLRTVFPELLPEPEALERFNQLIRYPFIESRGNYRYAFHELLREALPEETQKEDPEAWKGYHKRALDYLTTVSFHSPDWYYHLLAYDEKQGLEAWQQAIQEARESGKREYSGALLQAALDKALKLSPAAHAEIKYEEGRFNYYGVQWEEALKSYKEALASFKEIEDFSGHANCYQAIGDVQRALGKLEDALESYEKARAFYQQLGDQFGEARSCQAMGDVQRLRNDLDAALQCYERCLDLFRQVNDKPEEAKALEAVGDVQQLRNDLDAAQRTYEQALALYQEEKDRLKRAKVLKAIGDVQRLRQERNAALESYGQALALFGELKEPAEEAGVRQAVGEMERPQSGQEALSKSNGQVIQPGQSSFMAVAPSGTQTLSPPPIISLPPQQRLSRRNIVWSLVGLAILVVLIAAIVLPRSFSHTAGPQPTPSPTAHPGLTVSPASFNANTDCIFTGSSWTCTAALSNNQHASFIWSASGKGIEGIAFHAPSHSLSPGKTTQVYITVPNTRCPAMATFTFTSPANTVHVPWSCAPPTLTITPNVLNCVNSSNLNAWTCSTTLAETPGSQGGLKWTASSNTPEVIFNPSRGILSLGQLTQVTISVQSTTCPNNATFTFTGPSNSAKATWRCPTPSPQSMLAVNPASFNANTDCTYNANQGWTCKESLINNQGSQGGTSLNWSASSSGISGVNFAPPTGTLPSGQEAQVTITVPNTTCPASATFSFTGPVNTVTVSWSCTAHVMRNEMS